MGVDKSGLIRLHHAGRDGAIRPSASYLFWSVAQVYAEKSAGVLLTGMGRDGAEELKIMRDKGAVTIIQDRDSSVVYGMPGAAQELGAAMYELSPDKIGSALMEISGYRGRKDR
jgi:two-component system chemotaxis response regulator CheB